MSSLAASTAKVGSYTLLSRLLGFVRDLVIARVFGADAGTDAFFVAFKIPNLMRRLFAEGAFSMAFVPLLNEYTERRNGRELKDFIDATAGTLGAVLLVVTLLGILAAPLLVLVFAPGFADAPDQRDLTVAMLRLTFPYVLFISLTAFAGGILNTYERFGVPAFTPVLLNLTLIGCALWLAPRMTAPITALAWGVLIAGIAQLAFQLPFLARLGLLPRPRLALRDPGVRRTVRLMGPALFGASVGQLNLLLNTILASFLVSGSISWLYYSDRLMEFPMGLLGVALGTVILPRLSQRHAAEDPAAFSDTLDWGLRWLLLLGVPAALGLLVLAGPIIASLFYSGTSGGATEGFSAQDARMTAQSLMAYALGLVGFIGVKVLAPGFYARQEMIVPVRIAVIAMAINIAASLILMVPMGHTGLALATTLSGLANAALLLRGLRRASIYRPRPGWMALLAKGLGANLLMGLTLYLGTGPIDAWLAMSGGARAWELCLWLLTGGAVYAATLLAVGIRPRHLLQV
ncbi:murein biosynthesis integral membrane protein MurJ [uncultured Thiodictyon sp.]|uniref:murein biosynthesis integral membrane protein MurJ n=1 Tax=uncultured Thiodictyon sp. TaxID=1846217 RepID=UPI0025E27E44|nr:murein biosynthesis integral membrane protein MurJ [uncultured Thiodictyon sp.]